jgi:cobalt/nickel transport system permease protein
MVFIRTWEQGEIYYKALASRGYNGQLNMIRDGDSIKDIPILHWILIIIFIVIVVLGILYFGSMNLYAI